MKTRIANLIVASACAALLATPLSASARRPGESRHPGQSGYGRPRPDYSRPHGNDHPRPHYYPYPGPVMMVPPPPPPQVVYWGCYPPPPPPPPSVVYYPYPAYNPGLNIVFSF